MVPHIGGLVRRSLESSPNSSGTSHRTTVAYGNRGVSFLRNRFPRLVEIVCRVLLLYQQMLYLFSRSWHWHPLLALADVSIRRVKRDKTPTSSRNLLSIFGGVVFGAVITVRVVEWFLRLDDMSAVWGTHADIPFPAYLGTRPDMSPASSDNQPCPLCRKPVRNACVSTGGFVFCYDCLARAIQINPVCPLSGRTCEAKDIIRVFS